MYNNGILEELLRKLFLEIHLKITERIKDQGLKKRDFIKIVIEKNILLKSTNKPPSEAVLYSYLSGRREIPFEMLIEFCKILDISLDQLVGEEFNPKNVDIGKIISLLEYAPKNFLLELETILDDFKKTNNLHKNTIKKTR